jgi:hypothetical protein
VGAHAHVESVLAAELYKRLVGGNTCCLERFAGQLFALVGDEVHYGGKLINGSLLVANVVNSQLGVCRQFEESNPSKSRKCKVSGDFFTTHQEHRGSNET